MDNKKYSEEALRTNTPEYLKVTQRIRGIESELSLEKSIDLLHASMGLVTEAGEFQDALKKHLFYGKNLDKVNLREEIGDILWYCAIALKALDSDFESVMATNIAKLKMRYPDKFTEESAIIRDIDKEREILEK